MAGVTATGFVKKTYEEIKNEMVTDAQSIFGNELNLEDSTYDGMTINMLSEFISELWNVAEETYNAYLPSNSTSSNLSALVELNGIERYKATYSTVTLTFTGTNGTVIQSGKLVENNDGSLQVSTNEEVTITSGSVDVLATLDTLGDIDIPSNTMTVIVSSLAGVTVNNSSDGVRGRNEETDTELRNRRDKTLSNISNGTINSIDSALNSLDGIIHAKTYENDTTSTDTNGLPPKSITSVVLGSSDSDIAQAIFQNKSAGCQTNGDTTITVTDKENGTHDINFKRPTDIPIYISVSINIIDSNEYPGDDEVKKVIVEYTENANKLTSFSVGDDVLYSRMYTPLNTIAGCEVTDLRIGTTSSPTGAITIPIAFDSISSFDTSNITITQV